MTGEAGWRYEPALKPRVGPYGEMGQVVLQILLLPYGAVGPGPAT